MTERERNQLYIELGQYFRSAGLHPSTLVRRWHRIERFVETRHARGASVAEIAADLGLIGRERAK